MLLANLKVNKKPLVQINQLFKVVNFKTNIKGYWKNSNGKIITDNIFIEYYFSIHNIEFKQAIKQLFRNGEKCVASKTIFNQLLLESADKTWQILPYQTLLVEKRKPSKNYINLLLNFSDGLTIYHDADNQRHIIEIFHTCKNVLYAV